MIRRLVRKIIKLFVYLLLCSFFLTLIIQIPWVQTRVVQWVASSLSDRLGSPVSVARVSIKYLSKIDLDQVFVADYQKDTLFYAAHLYVGLPYYIYNFQSVHANKIELDRMVFNLKTYAGQSKSNLDVFLDLFQSKEKKDPILITASSLILNDCVFHYENRNDTSLYSQLVFYKINANLGNLSIKNNVFDVLANQLSFVNNRNNQVRESHFRCLVDSSSVRLTDLSLKTQASELSLTYFTYYLADFKKIPAMDIEIQTSRISSTDFMPWVIDKKSSDTYDFNLEGLVAVRQDTMHFKSLSLFYGLESKLKWSGYVFIPSTTDIWEDLGFNIQVDKLVTNRNEFNQWMRFIQCFQDSVSKNKVEIPAYITSLGELSFAGKMQKNKTTALLEGGFKTDAGSLDVNVRSEGLTKDDLALTGKIKSKDFNFSKFVQNDSVFSSISSSIKFDLTLKKQLLSSKIQGNIDTLYVKGTPYHQISIDGRITERFFEGSIISKDDKMNFVFDGKLNYEKNKEQGDFTLKVNSLYLNPLGFPEKYDQALLSFDSKVHLIKNQQGNYQGGMDLKDVFLRDARQKSLMIKELNFIISPVQEDHFLLKLESDYFSSSYVGNMKFKENLDYLKVLWMNKMGHQDQKVKQVSPYFSFYFQAFQMKPFWNYFTDDFECSDKTVIHLQSNTINKGNHFIQMNIPYARLMKHNVHALTVQGQIDSLTLTGKALADQIHFHEIIDLYKTNIDFSQLAQSSKVLIDLNSQLSKDSLLNIELKALSYLSNKQYFHVDVDPVSKLILNDNIWNISSALDIQTDSVGLFIKQLFLSKDHQYVKARGRVNKTSEMDFEFHEFDLSLLPFFTSNKGFEISGFSSGRGALTIDHRGVIPVLDLRVKNLIINQQEVGSGELFLQYISSDKKVYVKSTFEHALTETFLKISGYYKVNVTEDALDLDIDVMPINLVQISRYFKGILSDVQGKGDVQLKLTGTFERPIIQGQMTIDSLRFKVDYLRTHYSLRNQTLEFTPDFIGLNNVVLYDEENNSARANLTLYHQNFKKLNYDILVSFNQKFKCLNTRAKDNDYFYGTAYIKNGFVNISGFEDVTNIEVEGTSAENTSLYIPMDAPAEITKSNFIVFRDKRSKDKKDKPKNLLMPGLNLDFKFLATPEAKIQVVFDEQAGDIIHAEGNGNLQMLINDIGRFQMYGDYVLDKGDYLFTYEKVINKKFQILPGSSISWSGDPYKAFLDINAVYRLRTSLNSLISTTTDSSSSNPMAGRRVPVDCKMHLTEDMMKPSISFDIELPTLSQTDPVQDVLKSVMNSEDSKRWQFFSLLVLNRFDMSNTGSFSNTVSSGATASPYELLSNQLSKFLSKSTDKVSLAVNYRPGDEVSAEEMQVGMSTQLFDDRLTLEGNLGVSNAQNSSSTISQNTSGVAGDVLLEYRLAKDGSTSVKAYNKTNNANILDANTSPYTQGVGISIKKEFNTLGELFRSLFKKRREEP